MKTVAVVSYCRTGIAKAARGALNQTHGIPMTAHVLKGALERAGVAAAEVEDVVVGCGLPEGATGHNIARNAALAAGFGDGAPGITVNRYCGSGLSAASIVANRIAAGEMSVGVAAGVESISLVQFSLNMNGFFYEPLQRIMPAVWWTMNQTADFVAQKYGITREAQDAYVVESQKRVAAAGPRRGPARPPSSRFPRSPCPSPSWSWRRAGSRRRTCRPGSRPPRASGSRRHRRPAPRG